VTLEDVAVPKLRQRTLNQRCVTTQKSEGLNYPAAEASKLSTKIFYVTLKMETPFTWVQKKKCGHGRAN